MGGGCEKGVLSRAKLGKAHTWPGWAPGWQVVAFTNTEDIRGVPGERFLFVGSKVPIEGQRGRRHYFIRGAGGNAFVIR